MVLQEVRHVALGRTLRPRLAEVQQPHLLGYAAQLRRHVAGVVLAGNTGRPSAWNIGSLVLRFTVCGSLSAMTTTSSASRKCSLNSPRQFPAPCALHVAGTPMAHRLLTSRSPSGIRMVCLSRSLRSVQASVRNLTDALVAYHPLPAELRCTGGSFWVLVSSYFEQQLAGRVDVVVDLDGFFERALLVRDLPLVGRSPSSMSPLLRSQSNASLPFEAELALMKSSTPPPSLVS